jgi:tetratricopeptide (TPR) repeat protein
MVTVKQAHHSLQTSQSTVKRQSPLPAKEAALFRSILRFYKHKQYKKALKSAEQILKKFPDHGETLAIKSLLYHYLGRPKEESFDLIRKGIRSDINSSICWHLFGLLHHANKNYEEASKCYLNALRHEENNLQILRDLSQLQIHLRNLEGYHETRLQLLNIKPQNKASWIGLAISYHLLKDIKMAVKVLDAYEGTLTQRSKTDAESTKSIGREERFSEIELSEILLYKISMLIEAEHYQEALDQLVAMEKSIYDKRAYKEFLAFTYLKLNRLSKAEQCYLDLLKENPECLDLTSNDQSSKQEMLKHLDNLAKQIPLAYAPQRLCLNLADGEDFRQRMSLFMDKWLQKGIPSLFASLKQLFSDKQKEAWIENIALNIERQQSSSNASQTLLWTFYFLAQLYDKKGETLKASSYLNAAISRDSTIPELLMMKAKILKHSGDINGAVESINKARELDLTDRYINTKCVKYMIRSGQIEDAERIAMLFTKVLLKLALSIHSNGINIDV